jgi:hypothetical protein
MTRSAIDLEPYRAQIISRYAETNSIQDLIEFIAEQFGIKIRNRTIRSRLQIWGCNKNNCTASTDTNLHARIKILFFQVGLEEKDLLYALKQEGFDLRPRTLKYIRHRLGLFRRTTNLSAAQQQVDSVIGKLEEELNKGQIDGYGRELLHRHFRRHGYMIAR